MSDLLALAFAQLKESDPHANRRAVWFARSALEDIITGLLQAKHIEVGPHASGRAKLSCVEALYREHDSTLANRAQYAWSRLSEACHQHAYELTPTYSEVAHLLQIVSSLRSAPETLKQHRGSGSLPNT